MVYPTVLNIYGGPEVQTVSNSFKGMRQLRMHMLASQGYCVICIDSRGSRHRGVQVKHLHFSLSLNNKNVSFSLKVTYEDVLELLSWQIKSKF